jgi:hypothetical protein
MSLVLAFYVDVSNEGLPLWQVVPLTILGCAIAYGLIWCFLALVRLPGNLKVKRRARQVETAAGEAGPYGVPAVTQAAERLLAEMYSAWDAGDRDRLARISEPDLMAAWSQRLDRYAAQGKRQRIQLRDRPKLEYVSLMADRGLVRLRVRVKLRRGFQRVNRNRSKVQKRPTGAKVTVDQFWTLYLSGDTWILSSSRPLGNRAKYISEPIVVQTAEHVS